MIKTETYFYTFIFTGLFYIVQGIFYTPIISIGKYVLPCYRHLLDLAVLMFIDVDPSSWTTATLEVGKSSMNTSQTLLELSGGSTSLPQLKIGEVHLLALRKSNCAGFDTINCFIGINSHSNLFKTISQIGILIYKQMQTQVCRSTNVSLKPYRIRDFVSN